MLKIENVSVTLGNKQVLRNISMNVRDGEFLALLGASGCGKSTLLKTICGYIPFQAGHIYMDDICIDALPVHLRNIVIVFQDLRLFPTMLAWENVAFPMKMKKIKKEERRAKAYEWLKLVDLAGFENRKIYDLSGGQQQRIALARAFAAKPKILLLDEPFTGLDEELRLEMQNLLIALHKEYNTSIIFVTHNKGEAEVLSDRIVNIIEGVLV